MSDRKYRQHGYQDRNEDDRTVNRQTPAQNRDMTYGPRAVQMAPVHKVSRCAQCGVVFPATVDVAGKCQCGAAIHSCKQCVNFDPGSRFECRLTLPGFPKKDLHNECTSFVLRSSVERETSSGGSRVEDARRAFENLFKK